MNAMTPIIRAATLGLAAVLLESGAAPAVAEEQAAAAKETPLQAVTREIEALGIESEALIARMTTLKAAIAASSRALLGGKPDDPEREIGLRDRYLAQLAALADLAKGSQEWTAADAAAQAMRLKVDELQASIDADTLAWKQVRAQAAAARIRLDAALGRLEELSREPADPGTTPTAPAH